MAPLAWVILGVYGVCFKVPVQELTLSSLPRPSQGKPALRPSLPQDLGRKVTGPRGTRKVLLRSRGWAEAPSLFWGPRAWPGD